MFLAFYAWHGWILNDIDRLAYPKDFFLLVSSCTYLGIGALMAFFVQILTVPERLPRRGWVVGIFAGVFIFSIAFVFGVSFNSSQGVLHLLTDFCWQVLEQTSGGWLCGLTVSYLSYLQTHKEAAES